MESDNSNLIRVKIMKRKDTGLGFLIQSRPEKPYVVISAMVSGGMAEKCGLMRIGDVILRVNDIDMTDMLYDKCVEHLKSLPNDIPVSLLLRGPDGYISYLHTTFLTNGSPNTSRITKPIQNNESFVSRLRRTFGRSLSPTNRTSHRQSRRGNNICGTSQTNCFNDDLDNTCFVGPLNHDDNFKVQNDAESQTDAEISKQSSSAKINSESKTANFNNNNSFLAINDVISNSKIDSINGKHKNNVSNDSHAQLSVISSPSFNGAENAVERRESSRSPSMQRKESMANNSPAQQRRYVKLRNVAESKLVFTDTLHSKVIEVCRIELLYINNTN